MVRGASAAAGLVALTIAVFPPAAAGQQGQIIQEVAWLTGCWEQAIPGGIIEERWMPPRAGTMIGVSRTTRDGSLRNYELVLLSEREGGLAYEADPSGQAVATFLASEITDSLVVFENPAHDFPKRIGYRRGSGDSLVAWIDGGAGATDRRVEFLYGRVECGARN